MTEGDDILAVRPSSTRSRIRGARCEHLNRDLWQEPGPLDSEEAAESVASYLRTRLARLLISLRKPSQHVFRGMYRWVPQQDWDRRWSDLDMYAKYGISEPEVAYIESMIRPMDAPDE